MAIIAKYWGEDMEVLCWYCGEKSIFINSKKAVETAKSRYQLMGGRCSSHGCQKLTTYKIILPKPIEWLVITRSEAQDLK